MTFEIENDIPIPGPKGRLHHYPFSKMDIGQSFFVPE